MRLWLVGAKPDRDGKKLNSLEAPRERTWKASFLCSVEVGQKLQFRKKSSGRHISVENMGEKMRAL